MIKNIGKTIKGKKKKKQKTRQGSMHVKCGSLRYLLQRTPLLSRGYKTGSFLAFFSLVVIRSPSHTISPQDAIYAHHDSVQREYEFKLLNSILTFHRSLSRPMLPPRNWKSASHYTVFQHRKLTFNRAKADLREKGGIIRHEYSIIKGFT